MQLGQYAIRVNAILPGAVDGPRLQKVIEGRAKLSGQTLEEEERMQQTAVIFLATAGRKEENAS
jgi:NAD(P)-dependent dehydrogenase (short-subunit alcohol dehydrogenase family)